MLHIRHQTFQNWWNNDSEKWAWSWQPNIENFGAYHAAFMLNFIKHPNFFHFWWQILEAATRGGFFVSSSCLCLLVTALSFTATAGSDKLKEFARVGVFSTAITKFNWVNCWKHNIFQQNCILFGIIDIFARRILCMELSPHVKCNSRCHFICYQQVCPLILLPTV